MEKRTQKKDLKQNLRRIYERTVRDMKPRMEKDFSQFSSSLFSGKEISTQNYGLQKLHPLIYRVIDSYASDSTRKWINFTGSQEKIDYLEKRFMDLGIKEKIRQSLFSALMYGESLLYLGIEESKISNGRKKNKQVVNKEEIEEISFVNVVSRRFFYRLPRTNINPVSESFSRQQFVLYGAGDFVHEDRLLWLCNFYDPDTNLGMSYFEMLHEISSVIEHLLHGVGKSASRLSSYFVFSDMMLDVMTEEKSDALLSDMKYQMDNNSMVALESGAKMETTQLVATGFDLLKDYVLELFTAISGVPQNILLGRAQGVMASAEQDGLNYYARVHQSQETILRPMLTKIIEYLLSEKEFKKDTSNSHLEDIDFYFVPLIEENPIDVLNRQNLELDILFKLSSEGLIEDQDVLEKSGFCEEKGFTELPKEEESSVDIERLLEGYRGTQEN